MIIELDNIQNVNFNKSCIQRLIHEADWKLSVDQNYHTDNVSQGFSDTGMLFVSYSKIDRIGQDNNFVFFNNVAQIIFNSVLINLDFEFKNIELKRFLWNYYNKSSTGVLHQDYNQPDWYSIVYNFSDSDGGTVIENKFVEGKQGRAVLFPSIYNHRGVGPTTSLHRFALNIVFTAEIE